ncbi:hypothetical protein Q6D67_18690 [Haliea sp. E1-2-M8]|uniref:hypothetical protein n=1 Tax=Haliea sp. E1-2-M8 TaxID=3064706 RepID=UPI002722F6C5|nr:hypothetical protein [Haliea sp. E1-2-M8]MDO8863724.1 hypothetical protein [Haliea sp. E1-2-M8]
MKTFGAILVVIGILWALMALAMDTTVRSGGTRVHNVGLVEERRTHLTLAGVATLAGVILFGFGASARTNVTEVTRICPKCAESILAAATKCRYCGSDVEPVLDSDPDNAPPDDTELERLLDIIENGYAPVEIYRDAIRAAGGKLKVEGSFLKARYIVCLKGAEHRIEKLAELRPWYLENLRPLVAKQPGIDDEPGRKTEPVDNPV